MAPDPTTKKLIAGGQPLVTTSSPKIIKNPNLLSFSDLVSERQQLLSKLDGARKEASTLRTQSDVASSKADAFRLKGDETLSAAAVVSSGTSKTEEDKRQLLEAQKEKANKVFSAMRAWAEARLQDVVSESKFLASLDASSRVSDYERDIRRLDITEKKVLKNEQLDFG